MRCDQSPAPRAATPTARVTMPAAPAATAAGSETIAEATVKTVGEAAVKAVGEAAVKAVGEAVVEMRKSSRHHDRGPESEEPRFGGPIRIIKRIGVIIGIGIAIGVFRRRRNYVDLWRQPRRILRDPPAPVGLLARLHDGLLLPANRNRNGVAGAGRLVGGRLSGRGRARSCLTGRRY